MCLHQEEGSRGSSSAESMLLAPLRVNPVLPVPTLYTKEPQGISQGIRNPGMFLNFDRVQ